MNNRNYTLPERLRLEIFEVIQDELNVQEQLSLQYKIIYDDDRRIYKIKVDGHKEFFVLKIRGLKVVKQQDLDLNDLKKEFHLLEKAWTSAKKMKKGYSMSKPIKLWLDEKAMLLSGCRGSNFNGFFNQHLFKWAFNSHQLERAIFDCGYWLGNYHSIASQEKPLDGQFSNRTTNLERMLTFLSEKQQHCLSGKDIGEFKSKFESTLSKNENGPVGQVHGNYAYRNVLYSKRETNLVDFEDAHVEHVAFDIGQFLAEIKFKSQFPWLRHRTDRLVKKFESGYSECFKIQKQITDAYLGYHLIVHLYEHCSRKNTKGLSQMILNFRISYLSKLVKDWLRD